MTPAQVVEMFKDYTDEADRTFLTDDQIGRYLSEGYADFRRAVCSTDPFIYAINHNFTLDGANKLDLTVAPNELLGSGAAAGGKMERLLRVAKLDDSSSDIIEYLDAAPSEMNIPLFGYALIRSDVIFGSNITGPHRLEYVPFHNVSFDAAALSSYIDDLDGFHDMIPLYAYRRYAIRDGAENPQVRREMQNKEFDLKDYLQTGRSHRSSSYVHHQRWGW